MLLPLLLLSFSSLIFCDSTSDVFVSTNLGRVRGFSADLGNDTTVPFHGYGEVFLGLPYAMPPLGEKRFMLPQPICNFTEEILDATEYKPRCYQVNYALPMSEDCLYLNVVSPNTTTTEAYPVMIYIHGGTLTTGGTETYHWKGIIRNLVSRGVVVVTIQYRLGLMGFFTTYSDDFPANRGLFDQIEALKWVKNNIGAFGGDPNRVTLFGQSAGAVCVSALTLSPLAQGLFQNVIQESGTFYVEYEIPNDPRGSIHKLRAQQICGVNDTVWDSPGINNVLLDCFLNATPLQLTQYDFSTILAWNVEVDGVVIPDYPEVLNRPPYPVLMGSTLEEYAIFIPQMKAGNLTGVGRSTIETYIRGAWPQYDNATYNTLVNLIIERYGPSQPVDEDWMGWTQLESAIMTGFAFDAYIHRDAKWYMDNGNDNVFLYSYGFRTDWSPYISVDGWTPISHSSELPYLWFFPSFWTVPGPSPASYETAENMGNIWTDFAKNSNPGWAAAGPERKYMQISNTLDMGTRWREGANTVYNVDFPAILGGEYPPISISNSTWTKLRTSAVTILKKWNSMACSHSSTPTPSHGHTGHHGNHGHHGGHGNQKGHRI